MRLTSILLFWVVLFCCNVVQGGAFNGKVYDSLRRYYFKVEPAGNFFIVSQGAWCTIFNSAGVPLFPFTYTNIQQGIGGRFVANEGLLIDTNGMELGRLGGVVVKKDTLHNIYTTKDYQGNRSTCDANGTLLTNTCNIETYNVGYIACYRYTASGERPLTGVMDTSGNMVIPMEFQYCKAGRNYSVSGRNDTAFIFSNNGRLLYCGIADEASVFNNDFIAFKRYGMWALKDTNGKNLTPYEFNGFEDFAAKGLIKADNRLLNSKGAIVLHSGVYQSDEPEAQTGGWITTGYNYGAVYDDKLNLVFEEGKYEKADFIGERFIKLQKVYEDETPLFYDRIERKFVNFSVDGEILLPKDAYVITLKETGKKCILKNNKILKLPAFTSIRQAEGTPCYELIWEETSQEPVETPYGVNSLQHTITYWTIPSFNDATYLLNEDMQLVLPNKYNNTYVSKSTWHVLASDGKNTYLYNYKGKMLRKLHKDARLNQDGLITTVVSKDSVFLLDSTGILYCGVGDVTPLYRQRDKETWNYLPDLLLVTDAHAKLGIYSLTGKMLLPVKYKRNAASALGVLSLEYDDSLYFFNYNAKPLFGGKGFVEGSCYPLEGLALLIRDNNKHWGVLNAAGQVITPFIYDTAFQNYYTHQWSLGINGNSALLKNTGLLSYPLTDLANAAQLTPHFYRNEAGHYLHEQNGTVTDMGTEMPQELVNSIITEKRQPVVILQDSRKGEICGVFGRKGNLLAKVYPNGYYYNVRNNIFITDSGCMHVAVIDTNGAFLVPFFKRPDLMIVNKYCAIAVNKNRKSKLYRFTDGGTLTDEIFIDSAAKAKLIKGDNGRILLNEKTVIVSAAGLPIVIAPMMQPVIWNAAIDSIKTFSDNLFAIREGGRWGLFNAWSSGWFCRPMCDSIIQRNNGIFLYNNDKVGVFNDGITTPPLYNKMYTPESRRNNYLVVKDEGQFFIVNNKQEVISPKFDSISTNGWALRNLTAYRKRDSFIISIGESGIVDVTPKPHAKAGDASKDVPFIWLAPLKMGDKFGLYNYVKHYWATAPVYDEIYDNPENDLVLMKRAASKAEQDSTILVNRHGKVIFGIKGSYMPEKLTLGLWSLGHWSHAPVVNESGKIIVPEDYESVTVSGDLLLVTHGKSEKKGIFNYSGKCTTPAIFDEIEHTYFGYYTGRISSDDDVDTVSLINPLGKMILRPFKGRIEGNKYANSDVVKPVFFVHKRGSWGAVDGNGTTVIGFQYDSIIQVYQNKVAIAQNKRKKWGMVDLHGKVVAPFIYDSISVMTGNLSTWRIGKKEGFINSKGKPGLPWKK